ncbi:GMC oxidoreductase [Devosia yakushimensis]|uniref:GMC oxidoreductase n=1 Tax=Devosia yakushimensis TaxID=470028 RepID=A0ABQ5U8S8_9HYPH|nr:GMC family oxidoreductase [Devosia yakushimensis]GLQ08294.1 GMC oxidoreductase [Devosia yakushimensis]
MLEDIRNLPDGTTVEFDLCIVGSGPVGLSLAREFIGSSIRVCVLESGGVELDAMTQSLAAGESQGDRFVSLSRMRRRQFGGLSNAWNVQVEDYAQHGVRHAPFEAIDFEKRDWLAYSGWPFPRDHLDPFYRRASDICGIGSLDYSADSWEARLSKRLPFAGGELETTMFKFGPSIRFFGEGRAALEGASNVTVYLYANVLEIEASGNASEIVGLRVAALSGQHYAVKARRYILAAGAIENARLLLASNRVQKAGLGNGKDLVGRFFMDHPVIRTGFLFPYEQSAFATHALYDMRYLDKLTVMGRLTFAEETRRRQELLGFTTLLFPRTRRQQSPAHLAVREFRQAMRERRIPTNAGKLVADFAGNLDDFVLDYYKHAVCRDHLFPSLSRGGWSSQAGNEKRYEKFELTSQTEQSPNPDNRITLSQRRDRLGSNLPKLTVHWGASDKDSIHRAQAILVRQLAAVGLGRLELENIDNSVGLSLHHNMGTTRMHEDPSQGVVDPDGKVHGIANLYIAGGSVFPTGSYANPTLTMIAMALRLADHLKTSEPAGVPVFAQGR